ncbi:PadR family transcriptional regulator [Amycolatopsis antarctica]|uniref:PadR family transcriptional regulator n=1 Tax=Amycolatopsis antarctica TaxID=1854586 RepID=A0A263D7Q4_9PSEU|nr:PadR family transcriptional regulator [Amycolatopsis antarctica]OZM73516.1 PadR family transcriptional regulator [Amycolatopsis antarctica]
MSATRLMVLGVVRMVGRTHGYQVRRELLSWNADKWGNIKPGSIYHALRKLTADGLLREVDIEAGSGPERTAYELTEDGEREFFDLLTTMLSDARNDVHSAPELQAALVFITTLPRKMAVSLLAHRLTKLSGYRLNVLDTMERSTEWGHPEHVLSLYRLWLGQLDAAMTWTSDQVERLENGELTMADDTAQPFGSPSPT